ncbi:MAG: hypothetical protein QUU85_18265, partial [Candidatus Eisenbacteria bacterium]|nr:hypothetical protein [Candidatus Eisenbacteria bacterium]
MPTGPRKREGKRKGAAGHESRSPDPILLAAARSLADGREPDWDALAAQEPRLAGRLRWMRLIRSVADACAQPLEIPPAEAVPPPDGPQPAHAGSATAGLPFDWGPLRVLSRL